MNVAPCSKGDKVRLTKMDKDPNPVPVGTIGEVIDVRSISASHLGEWQISMKWENGRTLSMIYPEDRFELVT